MRRKHLRTLNRVFARPTPVDVRWADIEAMLRALGVQVEERSGSRILLKADSERIVIHRPHPRPTTSPATVRDIAKFLDYIGVTP